MFFCLFFFNCIALANTSADCTPNIPSVEDSLQKSQRTKDRTHARQNQTRGLPSQNRFDLPPTHPPTQGLIPVFGLQGDLRAHAAGLRGLEAKPSESAGRSRAATSFGGGDVEETLRKFPKGNQARKNGVVCFLFFPLGVNLWFIPCSSSQQVG